jgi:tetratricopeptide (TPR) repeat protein
VDTKLYQKAIEDLTLALNSKPIDPRILYKRGLAYFKNREFKKAVKDLYSALDNKPFQTY